MIMDPGIPIPVKGYGGIERMIELLAKEYVRLGHEVHLLVTSGSFVEGCIMHLFGNAGFPPKRSDALMAVPKAWKFLFKNRIKFDLIHNFGRLVYLLPILNSNVKKIMSYQREITKKNIEVWNKLPHKNMFFTGCSKDLIKRNYLPGNWSAIYNCCDFKMYNLHQELAPDAPLMFLGRIEKIKGCHTAITVAKQTGNKLIIAGNISPLEEEKKYFIEKIQPHIDGEQIKYIGPVNDIQKNEWLGKCKALLMPIEWDEPFGIVMIEAMACGTPVIAFNRGSVNEVVDEDITGYKVTEITEMQNAVSKISLIDRTACRKKAFEIFDVTRVAEQYLVL